MSELIAYCGLRCDECKILGVTRAKDYEQKKTEKLEKELNILRQVLLTDVSTMI